jgi:hypothetical protein
MESRYAEAPQTNESGRLLKSIHLDYRRDATGNWVYKPATEFKVQADGAYSEYSFSVVRHWDYLGKHPYQRLRVKGRLKCKFGFSPNFQAQDIH